MIQSFWNGLTGLQVNQFGIDSTSNNIANVNTIGYKESIPEFETIFTTYLDTVNTNSPIYNDMNFGASVSSNGTSMVQGGLKDDADELSMAIQGSGWFMVGSGDSNTPYPRYTRDGSFSRNSDGYITGNNGNFLYGVDLGKISGSKFNSTIIRTLPANRDIMENGLKNQSATAMGPLQIPSNLAYDPLETTQLHLAVNLNPATNINNVKDALYAYSNPKAEARKIDFNVLHNNKNDSYEIFNGDTISVTVDGVTNSLTYGSDFTNVGAFLDKMSAQSGLNFSIDDNFNIAVQNDSSSDKTVLFSSSNDGLIDRIGLPSNATLEKNGGNVKSGLLQMPSYSVGNEVYDKDGKKYELYVTYNLYNKIDTASRENWTTVSGIRDKNTHKSLSNTYTFGNLSFDSNNGTPTFSGSSTVTSKNGISVALNLLGIPGEDTTTNGGYAESGITDFYQDGSAPGVLDGIAINDDGLIVLNFTNLRQEVFGRVGLVKFTNDQGLRKVGDNLYEVAPSLFNGTGSTPAGDRVVGWNENGSLTTSAIKQNQLEQSNTDLSIALTNLIIYQRAYAANSKTITTSDEMVQRAIELKR
jgi:flagellar hook protein FlgE